MRRSQRTRAREPTTWRVVAVANVLCAKRACLAQWIRLWVGMTKRRKAKMARNVRERRVWML